MRAILPSGVAYQQPDGSWSGARWFQARLLLSALVSLSVATDALGQGPKQMAITFDDLPFAYARGLSLPEQRAAVERVLATLRAHQIQTAVFVIGQALNDANRDLVDAFARAGHVVGNHSYSHRDLATTASKDYIEDIRLGGERIAPWLKGTQYFRYPFLRQGDTAEKRDAVLSWLAQNGLVVAPVTIDNDDFEYNHRLVDARGEGRTIDIRGEYLDHMLKAADYYDAKARTLMGRRIKQVLLLHMNYMNSLYLDDLLRRFRADGWSFIPFDDALKDDVYQLKYDYAGVRGAGHLDAILPARR